MPTKINYDPYGEGDSKKVVKPQKRVSWTQPNSAMMQRIGAENENARYRQQAGSENLYRQSTFNPYEFREAQLKMAQINRGGGWDYSLISPASPQQMEQARQSAARLMYNNMGNNVRPYTLAFNPLTNPNNPYVHNANMSGLYYQGMADAYRSWMVSRPENSMLVSNAPSWNLGPGDLRNSAKGIGTMKQTGNGGGSSWPYGGYGWGGGGGGGYTESSKLTYWNGNLVNWRI